MLLDETGYAGRLNVEYEGNRKLKNDFKILTWYTEWSKLDREGERAYDIPYIWNLKINDTNELMKQKRLTDSENERMVASG